MDKEGAIDLTAITCDGIQAMFFKLKTIGEEAFLKYLQGDIGEVTSN